MTGKIVAGVRWRPLLIPEKAPEVKLLRLLNEGIGSLFERWRCCELVA